jgi:hypothetical protein
MTGRNEGIESTPDDGGGSRLDEPVLSGEGPLSSA